MQLLSIILGVCIRKLADLPEGIGEALLHNNLDPKLIGVSSKLDKFEVRLGFTNYGKE